MYVDLDELPWDHNKAWCFNPRNGKATQIGDVPKSGNHTFDPPGESGGDNDWILVIEDADRGWAVPGQELLPITTKHQSDNNLHSKSQKESL